MTRRVLIESWVSGVSIATFLEPGSDTEKRRILANRGADMLLQMVRLTSVFWSCNDPFLWYTRCSKTICGMETCIPGICWSPLPASWRCWTVGSPAASATKTEPTLLIHSELWCWVTEPGLVNFFLRDQNMRARTDKVSLGRCRCRWSRWSDSS